MNQPPQGWGGPPQSQPGYPPQSNLGFQPPNVPSEADKKAQLSMYLGLGSIFCSVFTGIPAIILGVTALKDASPAAKTKAQIGIGVGGVASGLLLLGLLASAGSKKTTDPSATASGSSSATASSPAPSSTGVAALPEMDGTKLKTLREVKAALDVIAKEVTDDTHADLTAKGTKILRDAKVSVPVTISNELDAFLGAPTPLTDCEMAGAASKKATIDCTFKISIKKALDKTPVELHCIDSDGASITNWTLHPSYSDPFESKKAGEKIRVTPYGNRIADCFEKNVASIQLRLGESSGGNSATAAEPAKKGTFPDLVGKFHAMTEIQQKKYAETFEGTVLSGSGNVFEVEKCGFMDDSQEYGKSCWKVVLDNGNPRVALYHSDSDEEKIAKYKKGQRISFKDCKGISIKNWGFWSTATCDMPSSN